MIPLHITPPHVLYAINQIDLNGTPLRRGARSWAVLHNNVHYPCKLLISWANIPVEGQEFPSIAFVTTEAKGRLAELGFTVVPI